MQLDGQGAWRASVCVESTSVQWAEPRESREGGDGGKTDREGDRERVNEAAMGREGRAAGEKTQGDQH